MLDDNSWCSRKDIEIENMLKYLSSSVGTSNIVRSLAFQQLIKPNVCSAQRLYSASSNPLNLPRLPVPKLNDTINKYLQTVQPHLTPQAFTKTQEVAKQFAAPGGVGEKLQRLLEQRAEEKENWLSDWWIENGYFLYRDPVVVWSSPGLVWPHRKFTNETDRVKYTAKVISAALSYKSLIDNQKIPVERLGKNQLDMQQYSKIFGTTRIPGPTIDTITYNPNSKHVILVLDNEFYKIPVYDGDQVLSEGQIVSQIETCLKTSKSGDKQAPIGLLTSDNRDNWGQAYTELVKDAANRKSLNEINTALFVVSLDKFLPPVQNDHDDTVIACHQLIHGGGSKYNSGNRWYDKTVQFIIGERGINGLTYEHSPAEGGPIAVMTDFVVEYVDGNKCDNPTDASTIRPPTKLIFNSNATIQKSLETAADNINRLAANLDMNYLHFTKYGKNFIKSQKMSPDSFIQMAIQYAFYRLHKVPGAHYESASLRLYIHGRTETIRSCSNESIAFAKAMTEAKDPKEKVEKLVAAVNAHKKYVAAAIQGFGVDRHLFGLKLIAKENNIPLPDLYSDEGYTKSAHMRLSTSQVASKYDAFMVYGPLTEDGYGCCYSPRDNDIYFGLSSMNSCAETSSLKFKKSLDEALTDMYEVLIRAGEPQKSKL